MTINQAKEILKSHNRWRRGDESVSMANPKDLGIAIDIILEYLDNINKKTNSPIIYRTTKPPKGESKPNTLFGLEFTKDIGYVKLSDGLCIHSASIFNLPKEIRLEYNSYVHTAGEIREIITR